MVGKPLIVNLFAGPGAGKSTTAAGVFSLLKMQDVNAELVTEFAKDLTWEERSATLDNQYYVWAKQHHRMWRLRDKVDVMVTDSPLLLGILYGRDKPYCFNDMVLHSFNEFTNVNFVLVRNKPYNPYGRSQTEDEARQIDSEVSHLLQRYGIPYTAIQGDFEGANEITRQTLLRLGKMSTINFRRY